MCRYNYFQLIIKFYSTMTIIFCSAPMHIYNEGIYLREHPSIMRTKLIHMGSLQVARTVSRGYIHYNYLRLNNMFYRNDQHFSGFSELRMIYTRIIMCKENHNYSNQNHNNCSNFLPFRYLHLL